MCIKGRQSCSRPLLMEAGSGLASGQEVGPSAILAGTAMDREG